MKCSQCGAENPEEQGEYGGLDTTDPEKTFQSILDTVEFKK